MVSALCNFAYAENTKAAEFRGFSVEENWSG
jgi:hypothetical protein